MTSPLAENVSAASASEALAANGMTGPVKLDFTPRRDIGQLVTIVSGVPERGEQVFAINLATTYRQTGADVLLIDGVDRSLEPSSMRSIVPAYGLIDAVADRSHFDRDTLVAAVTDPNVDDTSHVPVLHSNGAAGSIVTRDLLAFLAVALMQFDIVVMSLGHLSKLGLLQHLLPISPRVFLLSTQDRATVRESHTLLLHADPARRWRDRVTAVIDCYESTIAPTAMQITETIGVPHSVLLPIDPQIGSERDGMIPLVLSNPTSDYSAAILKIAGVQEASDKLASEAGKSKNGSRKANKLGRKRSISSSAANRFAAALTLGYLAIATPCLVGADLFFIMGRDLSIISMTDLAWSNLLFAVVFLVLTSILSFYLLQRYLRQQAGLEEQLKAVTEHALSGIAFTDSDGNIRYANPVFRRLLNVSQALTENTRLDALLASRMGGTDPRELLTTMGEGRSAIRIRSGGQQELDLTLAARRINLDDTNLGWVVNVQDVTSGRAFRETSAITTSVLEVAVDGILVADVLNQNTPLIYVNKAFEDITGWSRLEVLGKNCRFLQGNDRLQPEIAAMARAIKLRKAITVTLRNYRKDGTMFWNKLKIAPVLDKSARTTHYIGIITDVTHQLFAAEQLEQLAYFDPLTSLPNRTRFRRLLGETMAASENQMVIVVSVDVQRLHDVNTAAGYERGDGLLLEITRRLVEIVPTGVVGRIAGGEFAVACVMAEEMAPETFVGIVRDRLLQRYDLSGASLHVTFAFGYTIATGEDPEIAMRQVSVAVHDANTAGLNEIRPFDSAAELLIRTRSRMTSELQQSLANDDFHLHYQPKVDLRTGALVGAEALVRWEHPVFGLQRPDRFISLAEQTGLIVDLGALVFRKTVHMAAILKKAGIANCPISVNVSGFQFREIHLLETFVAALDHAGVDASAITLEMTESVLTDNSRDLVERLHALRALGFGLSIDDFGTGYSSLRYLKCFPMSEIKLDRSFVAGLDHDGYNSAITTAVLTIGRGLGVAVVAEGVETTEEHHALLELNCQVGQGYLFSRPLEEEVFLQLFTQTRGLPWMHRFTKSENETFDNKQSEDKNDNFHD